MVKRVLLKGEPRVFEQAFHGMLIFFKERLALLSVPKTGTTAYHAALASRADVAISNPPELKHAPVYRYNRWIRPMFDKVCNAEMELVAVMREPISWLGSWYRFRQRDALTGHPNSTADVANRPATQMSEARPGSLRPNPMAAPCAICFDMKSRRSCKPFLRPGLATVLSCRS